VHGSTTPTPRDHFGLVVPRTRIRKTLNIIIIIIIVIIYFLKSTEEEDAHMINTRTIAGQERHRKLALTFCP